MMMVLRKGPHPTWTLVSCTYFIVSFIFSIFVSEKKNYLSLSLSLSLCTKRTKSIKKKTRHHNLSTQVSSKALIPLNINKYLIKSSTIKNL